MKTDNQEINPNDNTIQKTLLFTGSVLLCLFTGFAGSIFTVTGSGSWYAEELVKPAVTPPGFLFGIVWTTLYILMGVCLYLLLAKGFGLKEVRIAAALFFIQLILNFGWSFVFFGLESPSAGFGF